jgi:hypothetical protein
MLCARLSYLYDDEGFLFHRYAKRFTENMCHPLLHCTEGLISRPAKSRHLQTLRQFVMNSLSCLLYMYIIYYIYGPTVVHLRPSPVWFEN